MIGPETVDKFLDFAATLIAAGLGVGLLIVVGAVVVATIRLHRLPRRAGKTSGHGTH